jgi:WS/DGAT/MGAT family acyltransferase
VSALERLTPKDVDILDLERGPIAGHTLKVVVLKPSERGPTPTVDALRQHVAARLERVPRCRQRLEPTPLHLAPPVWVDDSGFDLTAHVTRLPTDGAVTWDELRSLAAGAMSERLDRTRPLWSVQLVDAVEGGRAALLVRLHHAWADGATALRVLADLLWDETDDPEPGNGRPRRPLPSTAELMVSGALAQLGRVGEAVAAAARLATSPSRWALVGEEFRRLPGAISRELVPRGGPSPFAGAISRRRAVAFVSGALADYKAIAHAGPGHMTVNDVVLAVVAGGIRRWLRERGVPEHGLRCKVPVSLHRKDDVPDVVSNRDSFMIVDLPLRESDAAARLRAIHRQTSERKRHHDAETLDALFVDLWALAPPVERLLARALSSSREFAVNVSNLPGPRQPTHVLGARVCALYTVAEVGVDHGLRVSAVSMCDSMSIGLCADPSLVEDLDGLAAGMGEALGELRAAAG